MIGSVSNASQIYSQLFSSLDTKGQGYLEKSDFASAFQSLSSRSNSASSSVDDIFSALDGDSDGKVTESEFSTTLSKLQAELEAQFGQMRMQGQGGHGPQGMEGNMPPPPPPGENDTGFTKDELQSQLDEIGSSDSTRSSLISNIVNNFEAADTDGDGKVTHQEAMAYDQSEQRSASSLTASAGGSGGSSADGSPQSSNSDVEVMLKIMQLLHAYGQGNNQNLGAPFSASA